MAGKKKYTICVDFDGVIHRYDTPWVAPHIISDHPVEGAIEWLEKMVQHFQVVVFSTRANSWRGRRAMRRWLRGHCGCLWYGTPDCVGIEAVRFAGKPTALIYLDDRAVRFEGPDSWPTKSEVHRALPWHKRSEQNAP